MLYYGYFDKLLVIILFSVNSFEHSILWKRQHLNKSLAQFYLDVMLTSTSMMAQSMLYLKPIQHKGKEEPLPTKDTLVHTLLEMPPVGTETIMPHGL